LHLIDLAGDIANGLSKLFYTIAVAFAEAKRNGKSLNCAGRVARHGQEYPVAGSLSGMNDRPIR
jgi:hypothetical protein